MAALILSVLVSMFVALNLFAPIASTKVALVMGVTFAAGSLLVGVSYGLLDVINDWKGRTEARRTVEAALVVRAVFFLAVIPVLLLLPAAKVADGFDAFLGSSVRLFIAGWLSLWAGGWLVNTPVFSWLRERMDGRFFAARYLTTTVPTVITGAVVYGIAGFWGTGVDVFALIWGTTVTRLLIGVVIVPFVWLLRKAVRYADRDD